MGVGAANFIEFTRKKSEELGEYLKKMQDQEFIFLHEHPLMQAASNYQFLPDFDRLQKKHSWIDLDYKVSFVKTIFSCWRESLKEYKEFYKSSGFMFIFFEDFMASLRITVVAQTAEGNPYPYLNFVPDIRRIFEVNGERNFDEDKLIPKLKQEEVLDVIRRNKGSIAKPSANQLNLKVGELRKYIINADLAIPVNDIRKRFKKAPANLSQEENEDMPPERFGWQGLLPPNF